MSTWKVMLTDGLGKNGQEILGKEAEVADCNGITAEELLQEIGDYDAIIVRSRTKVIPEVFKAAGKLKVVGRAGIGVDNINLDAAKEHGVTVVNSPMATTLTVAELAMGLMLAVMREIPRADAGLKDGKWLKKEMLGGELFGKTLGVIGFGRIGAETGKRGAAFGMKVIGYDPFLSAEDIAARGGESVSLDDLIAQADVITLHVPMTDKTRGMLNKDTFARMKDGVVIVCAARGGVIDEGDLVEALDSGKVRGAGLDVFATEPPGITPLVSHPKVIGTPHMGAQTKEAKARVASDIADEVLAALRGDDLRWKVA